VSALPTFVDVARLLLPRSSREGVIVVLSAYFDDSGTHSDSDVVVMAGFIGTEDQWEPFDEAWKAKLKEPLPGKPILRRFHMAQCVARRGEFIGYSDAESDAVIHDFRQLILDAKLTGHVMAVDKVAWDEIIVGPLRVFFGDAEWFSVNSCLTYAINKAKEHTSDRMISLVFDNRPEVIKVSFLEPLSKFQTSFYNGDPNFPDWPHLIGSSFLSSEVIRPLQAADMLAWESYRHAKRNLHEDPTPEPREHLQRFVETELITAGFADRESIKSLSSMFKFQPG
jgi:Protein of unknown function (DUF3800)